jgi:hypothetical protein
MRPRTVLILLGLILLAGIGTRVTLVWGGIIPHEHDDLREATALWIKYTADGWPKTLKITEPQEVQSILRALEFQSASRSRREQLFRVVGPRSGVPQLGNMIEFRYANEAVIQAWFVNPRVLHRADHGEVLVSPKFHDTICDVLSREEGKKVSSFVR